MSRIFSAAGVAIAVFGGIVSAGAAHAQATDVKCSRCVNTSDLAKHAVTNSKLAPGAVTEGKLAFQAVTRQKLASNAVTANKIADGAVTTAKLDPALAATAATGVVGVLWGTYGNVPATTNLTVAGSAVGLDCVTSQPYVAGQNETAVVSSNVTAYFADAGQRQYVAGYTENGGALQLISSNGMATVEDVGITSVDGVQALTPGVTYRFQPSVHPDFADTTLNWVQCTTTVLIVKQ